MFTGLLVRSINGWLQDHVGVDIHSAEYEVECFGPTHFQITLANVALTQVLWRVAVGPTLPFALHSGRAGKVLVEVTQDEISVQVFDVAARIKEIPVEQWPSEAETYRQKFLKEKNLQLNQPVRESSLKRWVKCNIVVSLTNAQLVLQTAASPVGCQWQRHDAGNFVTFAVRCSSVTVAKPTTGLSSEAEGRGPQPPDAPFSQEGCQANLQVAKDVTVNDIHLYLAPNQRELPADWVTSADAAVHPAVRSFSLDSGLPRSACSLMCVRVFYRAWMPDAPAELPTAIEEPRRSITMQVLSQPTAAMAPGSGDGLRFRFDAAEFAFLLGAFANADSLVQLWMAVLAASVADVNQKPTVQQAELYKQLWRQRGILSDGGRELQELEGSLSIGFIDRLRYLSSLPSELARQQTGSQCAQAPCLGNFCSGPRATENDLRPAWRPKAGAAGMHFRSQTPMEFAADAAYQVYVPDMHVHVEFINPSGVMEDAFIISSRNVHVLNARGLDSKLLSVSMSPLGLKRVQSDKTETLLLDGKRAEFRLEYLPNGTKHIAAEGSCLSVKCPLVWRYLRMIPGLRPVLDPKFALQAWCLGGSTVPEQVLQFLDTSGLAPATTTYSMSFLDVCVELQPDRGSDVNWLPGLDIRATRLQIEKNERGELETHLGDGCIFCIGLDVGLGKIISPLGDPEAQKDVPFFGFEDFKVRSTPAADVVGDASPKSQRRSSSNSHLTIHATGARLNCSPYILEALSSHRASYDHGFDSSLEAARCELEEAAQRMQLASGVDPDEIIEDVEQPALQRTSSSVCTKTISGSDLLAQPSCVTPSSFGADEVKRNVTTAVWSPPKLTVNATDLSLTLWGMVQAREDKPTFCMTEPGGLPQPQELLRLRLKGLFYSSGLAATSELMDDSLTRYKMQLSIQDLVGYVYSWNCTWTVFLCSDLISDNSARTGAAVQSSPRAESLQTSLTWTPEGSEFSVESTSLHVAPSPILVQHLRLLLPGLIGGSRPSHADKPPASPSNKAAGEEPAPRFTSVLASCRLVDISQVSIGLHLASKSNGQALVGLEGVALGYSATAAEKSLSACANISNLHFTLGSAEREKSRFSLTARVLEASLVQSVGASKYLQPLAICLRLDALHGTLLRNLPVSAGFSVTIPTTAELLLRLDGASYWATKPGVYAQKQRDSKSEVKRGYVVCSSCISAPLEIAGQRLRKMLKVRDCTCGQVDSCPWLQLRLNGPGRADERLPEKKNGVTEFDPSRPGPTTVGDARTLLITLAPTTVTYFRVDMELPNELKKRISDLKAEIKTVTGGSGQQDDASRKGVAPPEAEHAREARGLQQQHVSAEGDQDGFLAQLRKRSWRFNVKAEIDIETLVSTGPCPSLRLKCVPESSTFVVNDQPGTCFFDLQEISFEIIGTRHRPKQRQSASESARQRRKTDAHTMPDEATEALETGLAGGGTGSRRSMSYAGEALQILRRTSKEKATVTLAAPPPPLESMAKDSLVHIKLQGLSLRVGLSNDTQIEAEICSLYGEYDPVAGNRMVFLRPSQPINNVKILYIPQHYLMVHLNAMGCRLHKDWVAPLAALITGIHSHSKAMPAGKQVVLWEPNDGLEQSPVQKNAIWQGPAWILPDRRSSPKCEVLRRCWLVIACDGSLYDTSEAARPQVLFAGQSVAHSQQVLDSGMACPTVSQLHGFKWLLRLHPELASITEDREDASTVVGYTCAFDSKDERDALREILLRVSCQTQRRQRSATQTVTFHPSLDVVGSHAGEAGQRSGYYHRSFSEPKAVDPSRRHGDLQATASLASEDVEVSMQPDLGKQPGLSKSPSKMFLSPQLKFLASRAGSSMELLRTQLATAGKDAIAGVAAQLPAQLRPFGVTPSPPASNGLLSSSAQRAQYATPKNKNMIIEIVAKQQEYWLPESDNWDERGRCVGLLLAADVRGTLNNRVKIEVSKFAAARAVLGIWTGEFPGTQKTHLPSFDASELERSFAQVLDDEAWDMDPPTRPTPDATPRHSPSDATFTPPSRQPSTGDFGFQHAEQEQLIDTRGLELVLFWDGNRLDPSRVVGVRLKSMQARLPLDLLRSFSRLKSSLEEIMAYARDVAEEVGLETQSGSQGVVFAPVLERGSAVQSVYSSAMSSADSVPRIPGAGTPSAFSPAGAAAFISTGLTTVREAVRNRSPRALRIGSPFESHARARGSKDTPSPTNTPHSAMGQGTPVSAAKNNGSTDDLAVDNKPWRLELDIAEGIDVTLAGGLLAPANWLVAEVSEVCVLGSVPPKGGSPLSVTFRCDVMCYNNTTAQLERVLEPMGMTVDVARRGPRLECMAATTRLNVNIHKVIVDFFFAVRKGLADWSPDTQLQPIRRYSLVNETGVAASILWPGSHSLVSFDDGAVVSGDAPLEHDRKVELRFNLEDGVDVALITLDFRHSRAYRLQESGIPILAEPENDMSEGVCKLRVRSPVAIHNHTAVPLSVLLEATRPPGVTQAAEVLLGMVNPTYGALRPPRRTFRMEPWRETRVPLDWFSRHKQVARIRPELDIALPEDRDDSDHDPHSGSDDVDTSSGQGATPLSVADSEAQTRSTASMKSKVLPRIFRELSALIDVGDSGHEDNLFSMNDDLQNLRLGMRMKFSLFFHRYLKLVGYVDSHDVPVGADSDDSQLPTQSFVMHIGNVVAFRNMLPFPVIVQLCPERAAIEAQALPLSCVQEAFSSANDRPSSDPDKDPEAVPSFSIPSAGKEKGQVRWHGQLDSVVHMTFGRPQKIGRKRVQKKDKVANYVLGVDQEVSLPLAKRSFSLRVIALKEAELFQHPGDLEAGPQASGCTYGQNTPSDDYVCCASQTEDIGLPSVHAHMPRNTGLSLWKQHGTNVAPLHVKEILSHGASLKAMEISVETTRNTLTFFAPVLMENLTHCTFHINPDKLSTHLAPMRRRLLPCNMLARDTAFFAMYDPEDPFEYRKNPTATPASQAGPSLKVVQQQELKDISDLNKVHQLLPMKAPTACADANGFAHDSLSFGVCVRWAPPPLRLTKIVSIFPRIVVHSELDYSIETGFCDVAGAAQPSHWLALEPGKHLPVHPPVNEAFGGGSSVRQLGSRHARQRSMSEESRGGRRSRLMSDDPTISGSARFKLRCCPPGLAGDQSQGKASSDGAIGAIHLMSRAFGVQPQTDDLEKQSTFHVQMTAGEQMMHCLTEVYMGQDPRSQVRCMKEEPWFVRIDIRQGVLPAKQNAPIPCGSHWVTLGPQNFRSSGDALVHTENCTLQGLFVSVAGAAPSEILAGEESWFHKTGLEDYEDRYHTKLEFYLDPDGSYCLGDIDLGTAMTSPPSTPLVDFQMTGRLTLDRVWESSATQLMAKGKIQIDGPVTAYSSYFSLPPSTVVGRSLSESDAEAQLGVEVELTFTELATKATDEVVLVCHARKIVHDGGPERSSQSKPVRLHIHLIAGDEPGAQGRWCVQLKAAAAEGDSVQVSASMEVKHEEGSDGVQHFTVQCVQGHEYFNSIEKAASAGITTHTSTFKQKSHSLSSSKVDGMDQVNSRVTFHPKAKKASVLCFNLGISIPVLSVSWIHRYREVVALKMKGIDAEMKRERNDNSDVTLKARHMQVDHFMDSEMPVMLNRRFLHINSRWLGKEALKVSAKWIFATRHIEQLEIELVPYWINLEIGVLIRLWDLADSSFSHLSGGRSYYSPQAVALTPPVEPQAPQQQTGRSDSATKEPQVWRLDKLIVHNLRMTVHVRSPDSGSVTDNPTARWITRLQLDMPNMDMILPRTVLRDRFGSTQQLLGAIGDHYKRRMKYSFLTSIIVSYLFAILKALVNAVTWLVRGPFDAVTVAYNQGGRSPDEKASSTRPCLWWVSPLVHGTAEGTYRALAEIVGNAAFGVVLIMNAVRHIVFGTTRPRGQSILDGLAYGFKGLLVDTFILPFSQLGSQTQVAYQDWGLLHSTLIFFLGLLRVPLGVVVGAMNFVASSLEGLANVLLHEEAQFANFEPQRTVESVSLARGDPSHKLDFLSTTSLHADAISPNALSSHNDERSPLPESNAAGANRWWVFRQPLEHMSRVGRVMLDDDAVMDLVQERTQMVLNA
eukprot:TRINITY_DN64369_c0_g3_i1.p1 TRINITY_DN64369_c0_g3~~TRINITY_DN64369_c0_g3_i1.p1  ORF type:complete len:4057 (+),score=754.11 TRINITY_DN64369_c0_g3_i1:92-12262(+)